MTAPADIATLATARFRLSPWHLQALKDHDGELEVLVTTYTDSTGEAALRYGFDNTSALWSVPVRLEVAQ
jgi:hypothetical protein